jgi:hypothetical protein
MKYTVSFNTATRPVSDIDSEYDAVTISFTGDADGEGVTLNLEISGHDLVRIKDALDLLKEED